MYMYVWVQDEGDIETKIAKKREFLAKSGTPFQPTPVFIGEIHNIRSNIVVFDDVRYNVPDIISALELTFCIYFALHAEYPTECDQVWLFIQQALFNIRVPSDNKKSSMTVRRLTGQIL